MKIAVYGNCQAPGIGACLRKLLPESEIATCHIGVNQPPDATGCDLIFAQPTAVKRLNLPEDSRLRVLPSVLFTGFHPDCTYIYQDGKIINSPTGQNSSSLIAACFLRDVPAHDVPSWFTAAVFEAAGFFDEFDRARQFLLKSAKTVDFDLSSHVESWPRPFMHTINHPAIAVLRDLCLISLRKAGISYERDTPPPEDRLARTAWPIYKDMAIRLGVEERTCFPIARRPGEPGLSLDEFAAGSYRIWRDLPRELIARTPSVARVVQALDRAGI